MSTFGSGFFVAGGTLRHDAPSYVERRADQELLEALLRGEFCYVLTARQTGKSSLMVQTAARLRQQGCRAAILDLTAIGHNVGPEQWYEGLVVQLGMRLGLEADLASYWRAHSTLGPLQRFIGAVREVALPSIRGFGSTPPEHPGLVIFIDEIDALRSLPFSTDDFFAAIRECFNGRSDDRTCEALTFCLLGVASPSDLVCDTRITPFNVGTRIELSDFTPEEAGPLAWGLTAPIRPRPEHPGAVARRLLQRVLYWTGGHPYLTQRMCRDISERVRAGHPLDARSRARPSEVDQVCGELFFSLGAREREDNLIFVRDRLLRADVDRTALLELYRSIRSGRPVAADEPNPLLDILRLAGIVRLSDTRYAVRNRIYQRVFGPAWVAENIPAAEIRRQRAAFYRGIARAGAAAGVGLAVVGGLAGFAIVKERDARAAEASAAETASKLRQTVSQLQGALSERDVEASRAVAEGRRAETNRRMADVKASEAARSAAAAERNAAVAERNALSALHSGKAARRNLLRLTVAHGLRSEEEGDVFGALLWFTRALQAVERDPTESRLQRLRIGALLRYSPRLVHHWSGIRQAVFTPDGRRILAVRLDGRGQHLDPESGRSLTPPIGPSERTNQAVWSDDGERLLLWRPEGVRVWSARSGKPLGPRLTRNQAHGDDRVYHASISRDGSRVVTLHERDPFARTWNPASGEPAAPPVPTGGAGPAMFSPDGKLLYVNDRIYDARTAQVISKRLTSNTNWSQGVEFGDNGRLVASVHYDSAWVWQSATGKELTPRLRHRAVVSAMCFAPDGRRFATGSGDRTAQVWDSETGHRLGPPLRHSATVAALAFSRDGAFLATASADHSARVWDVGTGDPLTPLLPHPSGLASLSFDAEGRTLLTVDHAGSARLWEFGASQLADQPLGEYGNVRKVVLSPDRRNALVLSFDSSARIWSVESGRPGPVLRHEAPLLCGAYSPDGRLLATGDVGGSAFVWDTRSWTLRRRLKTPWPVLAVLFGSGGSSVITLSDRSAPVLNAWDADTGRRIWRRKLPPGVEGPFTARSPNGEFVLISGASGKVRIFESASGRERAVLTTGGGIHSAAFAPDGRTVLTASYLRPAQIWETRTGRLLREIVDPGQLAHTAAFSPDGTRIATANGDDGARIWNAKTGEPVTPPLVHRGFVFAATFSGDGLLLATSCSDGSARVWDAASGEPVTPSLMHGSEVRDTYFTPAGMLLTLTGDSVAQLWKLPPETRSTAELIREGSLLSGRRLSDTGGMRSLDAAAEELLARNRGLAVRRPTGAQVLTWHLGQAAACYGGSDWTRLIPHLEHLRWGRARPQYDALLAFAHAQVGQWDRALAAHRRVRGPGGKLIVLEGRRPVMAWPASVPAVEAGCLRQAGAITGSGASLVMVCLPAPARRFTAAIGAGAETQARLRFTVRVRGEERFRSQTVTERDAAAPLSVDLGGATAFLLEVTVLPYDDYGSINDGGLPRWAHPRVELEDGRVLSLGDLPVWTLEEL